MRRTIKIISFALALSMTMSAVSAFADTTNPTSSPEVSATVSPSASAQPDEQPTSAPKTLNDEIDELAAAIDVGEKDEAYTGDINIYTTYGTLPTLYALSFMYKDISDAEKESREPAKGFIWYLRGKTANPDKLPPNVTVMGEITETQDYYPSDSKRFMAYARKLYATYPNAHFNLYCDDLRAQAEVLYFSFNNIPESQYNVHLLSDGTGSYSYIKKYLYEQSEEIDEEIENTTNKWNNLAYWYNEYKERAKKGQIDEGRFLNNNMGACYIMWAAASQDNIDYYLQWPELMISDSPEVNQYLDTMVHRVKKQPSEIYEELPEAQRAEFLDLVLSASGLTQEQYDETYLPGIKDGTKKYMIISGTSTASEGGTFETRVNALMEHFGEEYTYLYKPHPSWPASKVQGRTEYLESKGITELPAQTPMEVILIAYPQVNLGGYKSSLYMNITGEHVKFFFADKPQDLADPLPDLFQLGKYPDAVFVTSNSEVKVITPEPTAEPFSVKYADGNAEVTVPENGTYCVVFASYKDGALAGVKTVTKDFNKGTETVTPEGFNETDTDNVKVMLWDTVNSLSPKCVSDSKNK